MRAAWKVLLLLPLALACARAEPGQRIVVITLDTVRGDVFDGAEGSALPRTRAYAERGSIFTRAFAASNATQPTHASLFTGLHPWEHGVTRNGQVLDAAFETVAEQLGAAGFQNAAVVSAFSLERRFGFAQGFEIYREVFERPLTTGADRWAGESLDGSAFYSLAGPVVGEAIGVLDGMEGRKQLLWIHLFDAHDPYGDVTSPRPVELPELRRSQRRANDFERELARARELYRSDLAALDTELARLFDRLDAESDDFETHVLLTSDHGESFGERGRLGHGDDLGAQETRVPTFIVSPRIQPGWREDAVGSIDLARTLLALAGIEAGAGGRDLARPVADAVAFGMRHRLPTLPGQSAPAPDDFFAADGESLDAGRAGAIERLEGAGNVPDARHAQFADFQRQARAIPERDLQDEETREALRALGYLR